jgi:hypothetical protein
MNVTIATMNFASINGTDNPSTAYNNTEQFWKAINAYYAFGKSIVSARSIDRTYITPLGNSSFNFTTQIEMPNMTLDEVATFMQPLINSLKKKLAFPSSSSRLRLRRTDRRLAGREQT